MDHLCLTIGLVVLLRLNCNRPGPIVLESLLLLLESDFGEGAKLGLELYCTGPTGFQLKTLESELRRLLALWERGVDDFFSPRRDAVSLALSSRICCTRCSRIV